MPRPLIGLTSYRVRAAFRRWDTVADLLPADYARSVEAAGGAVVLLPPQLDGAEDLVRRIDGLVVSGGEDLDPARYRAPAHPETRPSSPDRDAWDIALIAAAAAQDLPTLGVCRGMQAMAVQAGGALHQHLPDRVGHREHAPAPNGYGWTSVRTEDGSLVRRLVGKQVQVSCHHHQAVAEHPGLVPTAYAPDGTLEAVEQPDRSFWVGVQWHPENGDDHGLFAGLVSAAVGNRGRGRD